MPIPSSCIAYSASVLLRSPVPFSGVSFVGAFHFPSTCLAALATCRHSVSKKDLKRRRRDEGGDSSEESADDEGKKLAAVEKPLHAGARRLGWGGCFLSFFFQSREIVGLGIVYVTGSSVSSGNGSNVWFLFWFRFSLSFLSGSGSHLRSAHVLQAYRS